MTEATEWSARAWSFLKSRESAMLRARSSGRTLEDIGREHCLTRERVRQLILKAEGELTIAGDILAPYWHQRMRHLEQTPAVPQSAIEDALATQDELLVDIFSRAVGFKPVRIWGTSLHGWWTADPSELMKLLDGIAAEAPMRSWELQSHAEALCASDLPLASLFLFPRSPLVQDEDGNWLRRRSIIRDSAYLRLLERGEPYPIEELAIASTASSVHTLREALRRDKRFKQIRPEGTWALTEWTHINAVPYANAVDATISVVAELGPLSKEVLFARVAERYPVSSWRLQQCLLSDELGTTSDGLIDLIKRGAGRIEEREPTRPATMTSDVDGNVLGVRLTVSNDLMRGSGVTVNPWITWKLGLHRAPMTKTFEMTDDSNPITITRRTSAAQISTLRRHVLAQGLTIGCELIVLLRVDDSTARIVHACASGTCETPRIASIQHE